MTLPNVPIDNEPPYLLSTFRRFEVIDHRSAASAPGRTLLARHAQVSLSIQDNGTTLKVFLNDVITQAGLADA